MRWFPPTFLLAIFLAFFFVLHNSSAGQDKASPAKDPDANEPVSFEKLRPLLKTYCMECHNTNKKKAGLDLEKFESEKDALAAFDLWEQVGEHLRSKAMPPPKKKQPTESERQHMLAWVKHVEKSQVDYSKFSREELEPLLAGPVMNRRLSRTEFNNTLRDLFGVDLHPGDLLPSEGGGGEGFDNTGATLFTTPMLMEKSGSLGTRARYHFPWLRQVSQGSETDRCRSLSVNGDS